jgi:hypothetical protein
LCKTQNKTTGKTLIAGGDGLSPMYEINVHLTNPFSVSSVLHPWKITSFKPGAIANDVTKQLDYGEIPGFPINFRAVRKKIN